jgi:hypothetical protein
MVLLYNLAHSKCLRINKPGEWNSCGLAECNIADAAQNFTFNANGTISNTSTGTCLVVTKQNENNLPAINPTDLRALPCDQGEGNGRNHFFTATKSDGTDIAVTKEDGPFMLRADFYRPNWALYAESPDLVKSENISGVKNDKALWLLWDQKLKCDAIKVAPGDCTKDKFADCTNPENQKKWTECPMEYCKTGNNIGQEFCRTFCSTANKENRAACDMAFKKFCESNPNNVNECGCFNLKQYDAYVEQLKGKTTLLPPCHIPQCAMNPNAYLTAEMSDQKNNCPSQQICIPTINASGTRLEFTGKVSQNCEQNSSSNTGNNSGANTSKNENEDKLKIAAIVFAVLACLSSLISVIIALTSSRS